MLARLWSKLYDNINVVLAAGLHCIQNYITWNVVFASAAITGFLVMGDNEIIQLFQHVLI